MKRFIIGIDIDGVIVDIGKAMLPLLCEASARPLEYDDLCSWNLGEALDINEETMNNIWTRFFDSDALRYAPPIDGAINGLSTLGQHEIWLVTSRPISTKGLTLSWLYNNRVHYDQIVFSRRGEKFSAGAAFDIFIEDFLEETTILAKTGISAILFNQPWNQSSILPKNCNRAYNWDDVLQLINNL